MLYTVYRINALENVLDRIIHGVLTRLNCKALMSHILKRDNLGSYLVLSKLLSCYMLVFEVIRTVNTAVDTIIRKIKRCEHNYSVTVKRKLYFLCKIIHSLRKLGIVTKKQ